ncbi:hypothetical protein WICPIJ_005519 [Wickerhamomyces pijperi]|uniref:Uncharacterized protein n=1 Tax=Wickerhamomyces pijperi TaxID=599730 RepID=A0A9P8TL21_WICPI|nr:hypothetical protein WICPIJ_005519 [Wickerhamomyces pijperi]
MNKIPRGRNFSSTSQKVAKYPELSTIETPSCNLLTQLIYVVLINYFLSGCMQCWILRRWVNFCIVSELLRYHHGEITLKECYERIYDIEKVSVEVFGKRAGSWFTGSDGGALSTHVWCGNVGAETPKQTPALPDSKYLEKAISVVLEESELADMAVRVFICDECECGTSYCAKVVDKEAGHWICNFCSHDNDFQRNRYFIYNKAELGINSFLGHGGRSLIIQLDNYFLKNPKANCKLKLNYSDPKKQPRENDFMFSGSAYASSIYADPVMRSLS